MMPLLLDPLTVAALAVGLATAAGFLLVAAAVEGPVGRRRLARRLDAVKGQKRGAASGDKEVRSLSMRGNISKMDQVARRWMPRSGATRARPIATSSRPGTPRFRISAGEPAPRAGCTGTG